MLWHFDMQQRRQGAVPMGRDELPGFIFQPRHRQSGTQRNPVLHITNGPLAVLDPPGDTFIPSRDHRVPGPGDHAANAWTIIAPLLTYSAEMIGEGVCR